MMELKECMSQMKSGRSFDLTYWTCDTKKSTGGELKHLDDVKLHRKAKPKRKANAAPAVKHSRNPHHEANGTINVITPTQEIRTVHIRLIDTFNGHEIIW